MKVGKYLTLKEVMLRYNKSYTQVRYATETRRLHGQKVGWTWIYPVKDLPNDWPDTLRPYRRARREPTSE